MLRPEIAFSPWDQVQSCVRLAPGVWMVSTPSHGGLMVERDTAQTSLSSAAIRYAMHWRGFVCFEEDSQIAIAFFERPDWHAALKRRPLTAEDRETMLQSVKNWEWQYYEQKTGTQLARGESYIKDEIYFKPDHAKDWIVVSAVSALYDMVRVVAVIGGRDRNGQYRSDQTRAFIVPAEEYKNRSPHGFVVDPARHPIAQPSAAR